jgi:hypothetical protein
MKSSRILILLISVFLCVSCDREPVTVLPDNPAIAYSGRFDVSDPAKPVFMYSGCGIRTVFTGTSATLILKDDSLRNMFTVIVDDSLSVLTANRSDSTYVLAGNLPKGKHTLEIYRRTEWHGGNTTFLGFRFDAGSKVSAPAPRKHKIEFIGDSYTCGYGNEGLNHDEHFRYETENNYLSYGAITARELDADYIGVCRSGIGMLQGYGGNKGFNMPAFYDEVTLDTTKKWDYTKMQPDLTLINLATNDLSAPLDSAGFVQAYITFVKRVRGNYPKASIVCIAGPSGGGEEWRKKQSYLHTAVDSCNKDGVNVQYFGFSPFEMNGSDWHPNVEQQRNMAGELVPYLKQLMHWQ